MEENNEEKVLTKKELKRKAEEIKLKEKERKIEDKREIKEENERRKNKLSYKIRRFIISLIFATKTALWYGRTLLWRALCTRRTMNSRKP